MRLDFPDTWWLPKEVAVFIEIWTADILTAVVLVMAGWSP